MHYHYRVHELWNTFDPIESMDPEDCIRMELPGCNIAKIYPPSHAQYPDEDGIWNIPDNDHETEVSFHVQAAECKHTIFSLGYVIQGKTSLSLSFLIVSIFTHAAIECPTPGHVEVSTALRQRLLSQDNRAFLQRTQGITNPLSLLQRFQNHQSIELVDGIVLPEQVLGAKRCGRKIVVLGDTCDSHHVTRLALDADVIIHECTNAYDLPESNDDDDHHRHSRKEIEARTFLHGHSTPETAGQFAQACQCHELILTHFSTRYPGDRSKGTNEILDTICLEASRYVLDWTTVRCAHDFEIFDIPARKDPVTEQDSEESREVARHAFERARDFSQDTREATDEYFLHHAVAEVDQHRFEKTKADLLY